MHRHHLLIFFFVEQLLFEEAVRVNIGIFSSSYMGLFVFYVLAFAAPIADRPHSLI